jgi:hypothetical protein
MARVGSEVRAFRMPLTLRRAPCSALALLLLARCHAGAEPAPPTASAGHDEPVPPAAAPAPAATAAASESPGAYAMCGGQGVASAASSPRVGPVEVQLSPAFLDEMAACRAEDGVPKELIAHAAQGQINAKGDCEFADIGVTCHYHSGSEFIRSSEHEQTVGQGELHCIFPSDDPKSPRVYGGHVVCKDHTRGKPHGETAAHEVHSGASCSANLLHQLEPCKALRCCDDGTLTNPIAELAESHRNDIRPDFRICDEALEVDCDLLAALTTHPANSPALGGIGAPAFGLSAVSAAPNSKAPRHQ